MNRMLSRLIIWLIPGLILFSCRNAAPPRTEVLQIQLAAEPNNLHPLLGGNANRDLILTYLSERLLTIDPETGELAPMLAESLPAISEAGTVYEFTLSPLATWPDGQPITAEDVVFSLKAILATRHPLNSFRNILYSIQDLETDGRNLRFLMSEAEVYNPFKLASIIIIDHRFYDPDGLLDNISVAKLLEQVRAENEGEAGPLTNDPGLAAWNDHIAGETFGNNAEGVGGLSGLYTLASWNRGSNLQLVANPNYWGNKRQATWHQRNADTLQFRFVQDPTALRLQLRQEAFDVALQLPGAVLDDTLKLPKYDLQAYNSNVYTFLACNVRGGPDFPLGYRAVRRALAHLLPVEEIIEDHYTGRAVRVLSPVARGKADYNDTLRAEPYDPERAAALLDEAGLIDTDGDLIREQETGGQRQNMKLNLIYPAGVPAAEATANRLKASAQSIGLAIELEPLAFSVIPQRISSHNFEAILLARSFSAYPYDFGLDFARLSGSNLSGYGSAALDSLIDAAAGALDPETRRDLAWQIQAQVHADKPVIYLFATAQPVAVHQRLGKVQVLPFSPYVWLNTLRAE